jgi:hypothetical protein
MKLRLLGNTVRLRMSQTEVATLATSGIVEDCVDFAPNPLVYMIHASKDCTQIEVSFLNGWITISVPEEATKQWAAGSEVGMKGSTRSVSILIEKDWSCRHAEEGANEDSFPRPTT